MKSQTSAVPQNRTFHTRWVQKRQKMKATKPLNSWIGFRTFYKNIFPKMQQKKASTLLTKLWNRDPFKAKWSIISAAYSRIRDAVSKEHAPIVKYLELVCPHIGILPVDEYLEKLGWTSYVDETDTLSFRQILEPDLSTLPESIIKNKVSGEDLIQLCAEKGYIQRATAHQINETSVFIIFGNATRSQPSLATPTQASRQDVLQQGFESSEADSRKKSSAEFSDISPELAPNDRQLTSYETELFNPDTTLDFYFEHFLREHNYEHEFMGNFSYLQGQLSPEYKF